MPRLEGYSLGGVTMVGSMKSDTRRCRVAIICPPPGSPHLRWIGPVGIG